MIKINTISHLMSLISVISLIIMIAFEVSMWYVISPFLLTLFCLILLPLIHFWLVPGGLAWRNYRNSGPVKLKGLKGWPLLGSIPSMGPLAHRNLAAKATSLGAKPVMALSLGLTPVIISSDPDTAREILCGSSFTDRPVKASARHLMFERAIGFAPSGTYWRQLRRIAANHMFSPRRISDMEGLRCRVVDEMAEDIDQEMGHRGYVELRGILQKGSLQNVLESLFGSEGDIGFSGHEMLGDYVREGYDLIAKFNWEDHFQFMPLDFCGVKRRCHKLAVKVRDLLKKVVEDKKMSKRADQSGGGGNGNDFLNAMLSLPKEDRLSDPDMVAVLWEMAFRGSDSVAILLEWIMARMVLHPYVQAKAQQEIDTFVGHGRHVRDSDIPNLTYLQAVVKECLRLHPPGPLLSWARLAVHDTHVGKLFVPAGTTAMVNMWAITHDPSVWKEPWDFNPERFLEEDVPVMGSDLRLAPFGAGRRVCPGRAMGLATVHLWLARLLQQFRWIPAQPVDLSECLRLSMEMKKPLSCYASRRLCITPDRRPPQQGPIRA